MDESGCLRNHYFQSYYDFSNNSRGGAWMERLDNAAAGLIEQEVRGRFPEGMVDKVAVLQYGYDPSVEPGQIVVEVTVAAGADGGEDQLETFHRTHRDAIRDLQRDVSQRWPQATRFKIVTAQ